MLCVWSKLLNDKMKGIITESTIKNNLVQHLIKYKNYVSCYEAKIKKCPSDSIQNEIDSYKCSSYRKNLKLKQLVSECLNGSFTNQEMNSWIIREWGGIGSFKDSDSNQAKMVKFGSDLFNHNNDVKISAISSLSKVASFVKPQEYFIYDSRTIFSLNWLLYLSDSKKFFFKPNGRNNYLIDNDYRDIVLNEYGSDFPTSVNIETYLNYCALINDLYDEVFEEDKDNRQPYKMEMLLYQIAPNIIVDEITDFRNNNVK